MTEKSDNAYKSIGEVAKILNLINKKTGKLNTHTIRFWEKEFKQIKPKFFNGNRRYYDRNSVNILVKIKKLLSLIEKLIFEYRQMKTAIVNSIHKKKTKWLFVFLKIFFFIFGSLEVRFAKIPTAINKAIIK